MVNRANDLAVLPDQMTSIKLARCWGLWCMSGRRSTVHESRMASRELRRISLVTLLPIAPALELAWLPCRLQRNPARWTTVRYSLYGLENPATGSCILVEFSEWRSCATPNGPVQQIQMGKFHSCDRLDLASGAGILAGSEQIFNLPQLQLKNNQPRDDTRS